jgi:hypothetical protein
MVVCNKTLTSSLYSRTHEHESRSDCIDVELQMHCPFR